VTAIMIGSIREVIVSTLIQASRYVDESLVSAICETLPEHGIIIEATKEELRDNKDLGGMLYNEVEVKPEKEGGAK